MNKKYESEEKQEIKKFIFVLLGLIVIVIGIYFFTKAFVTKDLFKDANEVEYKSGTINYETAIVGNMLHKPESEYYVIAYDSEGKQINYYNTVASKYKNKEKSLKLYYLDLNNALNKDYIAKEEEKSTSFKSIKDLKMGEITLFKIKNGKVTKLITNIEDIKKEFDL